MGTTTVRTHEIGQFGKKMRCAVCARVWPLSKREELKTNTEPCPGYSPEYIATLNDAQILSLFINKLRNDQNVLIANGGTAEQIAEIENECQRLWVILSRDYNKLQTRTGASDTMIRAL